MTCLRGGRSAEVNDEGEFRGFGGFDINCFNINRYLLDDVNLRLLYDFILLLLFQLYQNTPHLNPTFLTSHTLLFLLTHSPLFLKLKHIPLEFILFHQFSLHQLLLSELFLQIFILYFQSPRLLFFNGL